LHHFSARGLDVLEGGVAVVGHEGETAQQAVGHEVLDGLPVGRAAVGERSMMVPISPNDTSKTSCKTNASRSAGVSVSSTTVTNAWVDSGFKDDVAIHGAVLVIDVEQTKRSDTPADGTLRSAG
jgi:hypothetical protein